jgi:hypothetical protein
MGGFNRDIGVGIAIALDGKLCDLGAPSASKSC